MELFGLTLKELEEVAQRFGEPAYRARQIAQWLYKYRVASFAAMTNLAAPLRQKLAAEFQVGLTPPAQAVKSTDGTTKYLYTFGNGAQIESVIIPDDERRTLCLSTQAGCRRGCRFCATGHYGYHGQLTSGDILNQYAACPDYEDISNLVFMGMGEPFDNTEAVLKSIEILTSDYGFGLSGSRITVSTVGVLPGLEDHLKFGKGHVAISLHSPFPEERAFLVPAEKMFPIAQTLAVLRRYPFTNQRRLTFEYILFKDRNDSPRHAMALVKLLNGLRCRVNLIPFNSTPTSELVGAPMETILQFQAILKNKGLMTTIRKSKGQDIAAACGLLALETKEGRRG